MFICVFCVLALVQIHGGLLPVPPDFQYQNEKPVAANQSYFFKKNSMSKSSSLAEQVFFHFGTENGGDS